MSTYTETSQVETEKNNEKLNKIQKYLIKEKHFLDRNIIFLLLPQKFVTLNKCEIL